MQVWAVQVSVQNRVSSLDNNCELMLIQTLAFLTLLSQITALQIRYKCHEDTLRMHSYLEEL